MTPVEREQALIAWTRATHDNQQQQLLFQRLLLIEHKLDQLLEVRYS